METSLCVSLSKTRCVRFSMIIRVVARPGRCLYRTRNGDRVSGVPERHFTPAGCTARDSLQSVSDGPECAPPNRCFGRPCCGAAS